ncbi:MAG: ATP-binding protein [Candidatus Omnitrophota bacterium]
MDNPFVYGKEVSGESFCNRKEEISELLRDIENSQNVLIFSQRRFGKTSLIKQVTEKARKKGIIDIYVDLYPVLSEEDFVRLYSEAIANSIFGKIKKKLKEAAKLFKQIRPKLSLDQTGQTSYSVDIDKSEMLPSLKDALESVKRYADGKKKKMVVVFDEFQQVGQLETDRIVKTIRSISQKHRNISYIYMGSKKHLIIDMFNNPNKPFYRSAKPFPLNKIKSKELIQFVHNKFKNSNKQISKNLVNRIIETSESHPYYVQYLCHIIWEITNGKKIVNENDLKDSLKRLLERESSTYEATMNLLTTRQKQALVAIAKIIPGEKIFSSAFVEKHNLGSASTLQRTVQSLIDKDLIDKEKDLCTVIDVFFKKWLAGL